MADDLTARVEALEVQNTDLRRRLAERDEADGRLLASLSRELRDLRSYLEERAALNADQHELHEKRWELAQALQQELARRVEQVEDMGERRWDEITGVDELGRANSAGRERLEGMRPKRRRSESDVPERPDSDAPGRRKPRSGARAATIGAVLGAAVGAAAAVREFVLVLMEWLK